MNKLLVGLTAAALLIVSGCCSCFKSCCNICEKNSCACNVKRVDCVCQDESCLCLRIK